MRLEQFFLGTLLKITIIGAGIILTLDIILYLNDYLSLFIDTFVILISVVLLRLKEKRLELSLIIFVFTITLLVLYQRTSVPVSDNTSLIVIAILGFSLSMVLKGKMLIFSHIMILLLCTFTFSYKYHDSLILLNNEAWSIIALLITFVVLYGILTSTAALFKHQYDALKERLKSMNKQLTLKSTQLELQNKELVQAHEHLNQLNYKLEYTVEERTKELIIKNNRLIKYSHSLAHDLRGPVARLLGLVEISKLDGKIQIDFLIKEFENQTKEIDNVITKLNKIINED